MKSTKLILAGGFLGAGKTTLLWNAAQKLMKQGLHVGLITNDQAPELVDTALLSLNDLKVAEVSGSCFCCNFNGFTDAIREICADMAADVIIAEPVGSCTDLSATIIQPLKKYWNKDITVSPLSVLADPLRLKSILDGDNAGLHPDAAYIYRKQLEESDIILINKTDLLSKTELDLLKQQTSKAYPAAKIYTLSAMSGTGLDEWLQEVTTNTKAGARIVNVDYDTYAHGEAVLGWLNGTIRLYGNEDTDWGAFVRKFLTRLSDEFDTTGYAVGHVKVIAEKDKQFITGNLTGTRETISFRGYIDKGADIKLTINARVETIPEKVDSIIRKTLGSSVNKKYEVEALAWKFLQPGRPNPTYRFTEVVD